MKRLILGLALAMAASFAHGSYLYWQVEGVGDTFNGNTVTGYRVVAIADGGTYSIVPGTDYSTSALTTYWVKDDNTGYNTGETVAPYVAKGDNTYADLSTTYSPTTDNGYSYYIEIMGYGNLGTSESPVVIGVSEQLTYANMSGHVVAELSSMASVQAWNVVSYSQAPESLRSKVLAQA